MRSDPAPLTPGIPSVPRRPDSFTFTALRPDLGLAKAREEAHDFVPIFLVTVHGG